MILKEKINGVYVFEGENRTLHLTASEAGDIMTALLLEHLKEDIHYSCSEYDGDYISLGSLDMTQDEFEEEVFESLKDSVLYSTYPSEEYIKEVVLDTASTYGITIDD